MNCLLRNNFYLLLIILLSDRIVFAVEINSETFSNDFIKYFNEYYATGIENDNIKALKDTLLGTNSQDIILEGFPSKVNGKTCLVCYIGSLGFLQLYKGNGLEKESSINYLTELCSYLKIDSHYICNRSIRVYFPTIKYILEHKANLTSEYICAILLQGFYCAKNDIPYIGIDVEKPILVGSKRHTSQSSGHLKILQLTDLHFDPKYAVGSNAECGDWICCRGPPISEGNETVRAGKWGTPRPCDSPDILVENLIKDAADRYQDVDAIYLTGDDGNHFVWDKTNEEMIYSFKFIKDLIKKYFPGIPVFPALGNHDAVVDNVFAPYWINDKDVTSNVLYEFFESHWSDWIPKEDIVTVRKGGYYTTKLRPNLRIISLNNNMCYSANLWLLYDNFYFKYQLEWLKQVLEEASEAGEKVHILGHVPGNDIFCYRSWNIEYKKIIERYTHIISAQFNGHSHADEFVVYYAEDDPSIALNVGWNGGSGTTFKYYNQNYKLYLVNSETYELEDFEAIALNTTEANLTPDQDPKWSREYSSFKSELGLVDLSPKSMGELVTKMSKNEQLAHKYWRLKIKNSDHFLKRGCDSKCLSETLSDVTRTYFNNEKNFSSFFD